MCLNPETAHGLIFTQDQASMALEEITSPIQNQVFTTLESNSTPDKRSKFRPSEETKKILQPSSRLSLWKINDWRKPENLLVKLKIKPQCNHQGEDGIYTP